MAKIVALKMLMLVGLMTCSRIMGLAQTDAIEKNLWYNDEKTAKIQIYKGNDGKFWGRIIWLKEPNRDGKPKVDVHNPDKARQNDPIMGLTILKAFNKDGETGYEDGTIYDPKNGKTYSCKMTLEHGELRVRGYIGISLIGRTAIWTKAD